MFSSQKLVHPIKLFSHPSYRDFFILQNREKNVFSGENLKIFTPIFILLISHSFYNLLFYLTVYPLQHTTCNLSAKAKIEAVRKSRETSLIS